MWLLGVDGTRAFSTGKFSEDLNDDIDDLEPSQIADLFNWQEFFDKTYLFVGKLNGRFYDAEGKQKESFKNAESKRAKAQHVGIFF